LQIINLFKGIDLVIISLGLSIVSCSILSDYYDGVLRYSLPYRVIFYIIVFDSLMIYMISSKIYGALDITKHNSMILLQTKISNQIL